MNTTEFAATVTEAATKAEKFGAKAYLASVYYHLDSEISWEEFAALATKAHLDGELVLCRADLTPALNRGLLDMSEISYENATFHFLRVA